MHSICIINQLKKAIMKSSKEIEKKQRFEEMTESLVIPTEENKAKGRLLFLNSISSERF